MSFITVSPVFALADVASDLATIDTTLQQCLDKNSSNLGMKQCTGDAYVSADALLNKTYRNILIDIKKPAAIKILKLAQIEKRKRLVEAERAWITYRDSECKMQGIDMLGGTGESLIIGGCYYQLTVDRVKDIDRPFNSKDM
jgi:uncharacterized protein YecT (DUF1311 family)